MSDKDDDKCPGTDTNTGTKSGKDLRRLEDIVRAIETRCPLYVDAEMQSLLDRAIMYQSDSPAGGIKAWAVKLAEACC